MAELLELTIRQVSKHCGRSDDRFQELSWGGSWPGPARRAADLNGSNRCIAAIRLAPLPTFDLVVDPSSVE